MLGGIVVAFAARLVLTPVRPEWRLASERLFAMPAFRDVHDRRGTR